MSHKPKRKVEPVSAWWCETCKTGEMTHGSMMAHLQSIHFLETKGLKCRKKMLLHVDSADSFSSNYEVKVGEGDKEVTLTHSTVTPRKANDMMGYIHGND